MAVAHPEEGALEFGMEVMEGLDEQVLAEEEQVDFGFGWLLLRSATLAASAQTAVDIDAAPSRRGRNARH